MRRPTVEIIDMKPFMIPRKKEYLCLFRIKPRYIGAFTLQLRLRNETDCFFLLPDGSEIHMIEKKFEESSFVDKIYEVYIIVDIKTESLYQTSLMARVINGNGMQSREVRKAILIY